MELCSPCWCIWQGSGESSSTHLQDKEQCLTLLDLGPEAVFASLKRSELTKWDDVRVVNGSKGRHRF